MIVKLPDLLQDMEYFFETEIFLEITMFVGEKYFNRRTPYVVTQFVQWASISRAVTGWAAL